MTPRTIRDYEALTGAAALTEAERRLIAACRAGEPCVLGEERPTDASDQTQIRADLLRLLITGGTPECGLHPGGIMLTGGWIEGELDLSFLTARGRTWLRACHFDTEPNLELCHLQSLSLTGSAFPGLYAPHIIVAGSVHMGQVKASATTMLVNADIGGQLSCTGANFDGGDGEALNAQGVKVGADLFLRSVTAKGTVDVSGADIGGQLACTGASFDGVGGTALHAQGVKVGADLFLRSATAKGTVDVNGTDIGGQLACEGASFDGGEGKALNAQGVKVGADLFLRSAAAKGTVAVNGADIGGQLACEGASFDGGGGMALNAQRLRVKQGFVWRGLKSLAGTVDLNGAHVSDLADNIASWPGAPDQLVLDGFTYDRIAFGPVDAGTRLPWLNIGSHVRGTFFPQPYTQLAKVLWAMGHIRDARRVLIERDGIQRAQLRRDRIVRPDGSVPRGFLSLWSDVRNVASVLWDKIVYAITGYGYRPGNAIIALFVLWTLATVAAHLTWKEGSFAPNSGVILVSRGWADAAGADCMGKITAPLPEHASVCDPNPAATWANDPALGMDWDSFSAAGYGLDLVVPILDLGQTEAWAPSKDRGWWGWGLWWGRWVFQAMGWIVTALGAAAITGIIQRGRE